MSETPELVVADNEHTRSLGISGLHAYIESESGDAYSCLVSDLDGGVAGPYELTANDLDVVPNKGDGDKNDAKN